MESRAYQIARLIAGKLEDEDDVELIIVLKKPSYHQKARVLKSYRFQPTI